MIMLISLNIKNGFLSQLQQQAESLGYLQLALTQPLSQPQPVSTATLQPRRTVSSAAAPQSQAALGRPEAALSPRTQEEAFAIRQQAERPREGERAREGARPYLCRPDVEKAPARA